MSELEGGEKIFAIGSVSNRVQELSDFRAAASELEGEAASELAAEQGPGMGSRMVSRASSSGWAWSSPRSALSSPRWIGEAGREDGR